MRLSGPVGHGDLRDAAAATVKILADDASGIYNIVDDSPVRLSEWLPFAARLLGAPEPGHIFFPLYLLSVFGKNQKANLSKAEANELSKLVKLLVQAAGIKP